MAKQRKLWSKNIERIIELNEKGVKLEAIAQETGVSVSAVCRWLKEEDYRLLEELDKMLPIIPGQDYWKVELNDYESSSGLVRSFSSKDARTPSEAIRRFLKKIRG